MKPHLLTEKQWSQLEDVVKCFDSFEENGLGCTSLKKHSIKLVDGAVPVRIKSPWNHRTTVVRKPGKNRFCIDARKFNKLTVKDAYPLQNINEILSRIDDTHFISSVDLKYAIWQMELDDESKPYTVFNLASAMRINDSIVSWTRSYRMICWFRAVLRNI